MKLTRSTEYALLALGYIAERPTTKPVLAKHIAQYCQIPQGYLLKILRQLVRARLLESIRGPLGGFILAKAPENINLLQIVEAVEGPLIQPLEHTETPESNIHQRIVQTYQHAAQETAKVLADTSIASLIEKS